MSVPLKCRLGFHTFGEWTYLSLGDCRGVRVCRGCGQHEKTGSVRHDFGEWSYLAPAGCEQSRDCRRCGQTETVLRHTFGKPVTRASTWNEDTVLSEGHGHPTYVETATRNRVIQEFTCTRCGFVEAVIVRDDSTSGGIVGY